MASDKFFVQEQPKNTLTANIAVSTLTEENYTVLRKLNRNIWVTFQRAGYHCYPDAPQDVLYLRSLHRHMFKFKVQIEVTHDEREIEFHQFLRWLESLYADRQLYMDNRSCETIALELGTKIRERYQDRRLVVEVSEDGECGAVLTWEITKVTKG